MGPLVAVSLQVVARSQKKKKKKNVERPLGRLTIRTEKTLVFHFCYPPESVSPNTVRNIFWIFFISFFLAVYISTAASQTHFPCL